MHAITPLEFVLVAQIQQGLGQFFRIFEHRMTRHADHGLEHIVVVIVVATRGATAGAGQHRLGIFARRALGKFADLQVVTRDVDLICSAQRSVVID